jgi:flagellin
VEATAAGEIRSVEYGSNQFINIEVREGEITGITPGYYRGTNIVAQISGQTIEGQGNVLNFQMPNIAGEVMVQPGATGTFSFTIEGGGATFQIGPEPGQMIRIGIDVTNLGATSQIGNISTVITGGVNSLLTNPRGATRVIEAAQSEVLTLRGRVGAIQSRLFQTNISNLERMRENLMRTRSIIGETNFAEAIQDLIRTRTLGMAALGALREFNLTQGAILNLLA